MTNTMSYKGYRGTVEYSEKDNVLFGKVLGINGLISYEGTDVSSLRADFEEALDAYLEACAEKNIEPQKTYTGTFNVRLSPELHKSLAEYAAKSGKTLNRTVEEALKSYFAR